MKSIKKKLLFVVLGIILITLILTTGISGILSYNNTVNTLNSTMSNLATAASDQIETRLDKSKSVISLMGTTARLSDPAVSVNDKKAILNDKVKQLGLLNMNITDLSGKNLDGTVISDKEYFQKSIKGESFISDLDLQQDKNMAVLTLSSPLWENGKENSKIVGVVYAQMNGDFLSKITNELKVGTTGTAFMLDKQGYMISNKDYSLVIKGNNTVEMAKSNKNLEKLAQVEKQMIAGEKGFDEYNNDGIDKIIAYSPIDNTDGWSIAIEAEKNEFVFKTFESIYISCGIALLMMVISTVIFIMVANAIIKPVKEIQNAAKEMSQGNLNISIKHKGKDELGELAESFNITISTLKIYIDEITNTCSEIARGNFNVPPPKVDFKGDFLVIQKSLSEILRNMNETMGSIDVSSEQVLNGADQVSSSSQSLAQGATEQASSIKELSSSIEEVSSQIQQNAENSKVSNEKVAIVETQVHESSQKMISMIAAMRDINEKSSQIGNIIKAIDDIAFQTNILALNAAVEAARAGTAGKGFAVVAEEVKNLSNKSAEAAKEITKLIKDSIISVEDGKKTADETAESLKNVVTSTTDAIDLIRKISDATNEQATAVLQINQGVEQISEVIQMNSATAEESSAASEELRTQAGNLKDMVRKFKLKNN